MRKSQSSSNKPYRLALLLLLWCGGAACLIASGQISSASLSQDQRASDARFQISPASKQGSGFKGVSDARFQSNQSRAPQPAKRKIYRVINGHLLALGSKPRVGSGLNSTPAVTRFLSPASSASPHGHSARPFQWQSYGSTYLRCCALLI